MSLSMEQFLYYGCADSKIVMAIYDPKRIRICPEAASVLLSETFKRRIKVLRGQFRGRCCQFLSTRIDQIIRL